MVYRDRKYGDRPSIPFITGPPALMQVPVVTLRTLNMDVTH